MKISPQRIEAVMRVFRDFRRELELLHRQGEGSKACTGWPECDCRLAEQIRGVVHIESEWQAKGEQS